MKLGAVARPRVLVHLAIVAMFASILTVAFAPTARADSISVDTTDDDPLAEADDGDCTLREAVEAANTNTTVDDCVHDGVDVPDTIQLDEDEEYDLEFGALVFVDDVETTIDGGDTREEFDDQNQAFIDGGGTPGSHTCDGTTTDATDRVIEVADNATVELLDVNIRNGIVEVAGDAEGGGIHNLGNLTLTRAVVEDNIACASGTLNQARGGGIFTGGDATLDVVESTIDQNTASVVNDDDNHARGGGLYLTGSGSHEINSSTVSNNDAEIGSGGGGAPPATAWGGGIWTDESLVMENATVSGNNAEQGGGIFFEAITGETIDMVHVTITDNTGDGIATGGTADGVIEPEATIVADQDTGDDCDLTETDDVNSLGFNLDSDDTCEFDDTDDVDSDDADLDDLDENGGPTETHLPDDNSDAVNVMDDSECPLGTSGEDQRGEDRPDDDDDECDAGAVENQQSEEGDSGSGGSGGGGGGTTADDELDVTPDTATNTLPGDTSHTLTAFFDEDELNADDEDEIDFKIVSGPNTRGASDEADFECSLTGDSCSVTYTSNGQAGTDVICAWNDVDDDDSYRPTGASEADGGDCDTEPLSASSTNDSEMTDVMNKTWQFAPTPTPTPTAAANCSDGRDNDDDGRTDFPADPGCSSANDNTEANSRPNVTLRVGTAVSLFFRNRSGTFNGSVFAQRRRCLRRKVTLKHVDAGPNSTVGSDRSGRGGDFRIRAVNPNGKYYVVVKRKVFTSASGNTIVCLRARSQRVSV